MKGKRNMAKGWEEFKNQVEGMGSSVGLKEKVYWELSRCSDRHNEYVLIVMEKFDELSNEDKREVVQMLVGSLWTGRKQLADEMIENGKVNPKARSMEVVIKPEYFFGSGSNRWK